MFYFTRIKHSCIALLTISVTVCPAQSASYGDIPVKWANNKPYEIPEGAAAYSRSDLVILSDETELHFYATNHEKIVRHLIFLVNSDGGRESLQKYRLPESMDLANDACLNRQGRRADIKTPFISEYKVERFAARKFSDKQWEPLLFKHEYEKIRWIKASGEDAGMFMNEDLNVFRFEDVNVGDVVEIYYESLFNSNYGGNLFYLNSAYPKLNCEFTFIYKVSSAFASYKFTLPVNINDSLIHREIKRSADYAIITEKINLRNLKGINYPVNSFSGKKLPHVFADFRFYRTLLGSYPSDGIRVLDIGIFRPRNFEWIVFADTTNDFTKVYDKQFASLRKFAGKLPPVLGPDSTSKTFFKALCDTFNNFRYISSNQLYYNESNLAGIYSADHLLKRRLVEHLQWKLYRDLLNENKIFYYLVNIQDKRLGEHNLSQRAAYSYERNLVAIPSGNSYIYFMPRYDGMKYHLNELPFYLEGTLASLAPRNFQTDIKNKEEKLVKFIKTHKGTYNENTRTENASVKISLDSLKASLLIKESLSGQFSTVLRHLYLKEYIDSTISPYYFKKCVDKPLSADHKIKISSKLTEFPFRYNFACSEKITLPSAKYLSLKNWFSFVLSENALPETPSHDYYFDFDFSDTYNFLLDFGAPVVIKNAAAFSKKINNDYFSLESEIITNSENSYLVKVALAVKQTSIPEDKVALLMDLVRDLESLNNFTLQLERN